MQDQVQITPLQIDWVATYKDGTILRQEFNSPTLKYNGDMDTKQVKTYFIQHQENILFGVDVENRSFVIHGGIVHTDLPIEGKYELICFKRHYYISDGRHIERYCFGLKANIDGKVHQKLVFLNQDGTCQITDQS